MKDTTRCANCHHEYADHNYVPDSITQYRCPVDHVESGYGFFHGGDPRDFHPDYESCSPEEIANHKKAREEADRLESEGKAIDWACPSGWEQWGESVVHVLRAPFGIGCYAQRFEQFFEEADEPDEDDDEWQS